MNDDKWTRFDIRMQNVFLVLAGLFTFFLFVLAFT